MFSCRAIVACCLMILVSIGRCETVSSMTLSGLDNLDTLIPIEQSVSQPEEVEMVFNSQNPDAPDAKVELPQEMVPSAESEIGRSQPAPSAIATPWQSHTSADVSNEAVMGEQPLESSPVTITPQHVGFPNAQQAIREMYDDMIKGMNTRRVNTLYDKWKRYCSAVLVRTNSLSTGIELNNRSRLPWYEKMYREPLLSVFEAEDYSQRTYEQFSGDVQQIIQGIHETRVKMNVVASKGKQISMAVHSPAEALGFLQQSLETAVRLQQLAIAPLTPQEVMAFSREAHSVFTMQCVNGHTIPNVNRAKYLIDLMTKMNKSAMYDAAEILVALTDPAFLAQLAMVDVSQLERVNHGNQVIGRLVTAAGDILIGGRENNTWDLDALSNTLCVVDLGGKDIYREGGCHVQRPVLVVLDLGGDDDRYTGSQPGIQGASILGVSLFYNAGGNNSYQAKDLAQGSTIGGVGILIDEAGNDSYLAFRRGQGSALGGLGILIDRNGTDDYRAALLAQGLGHPDGFGLLLDKTGDDHYYVGGHYLDSYDEHPGYDGWGQGIGAGIRRIACGGIGMILDGYGDDSYEFDYFSHGGGYWMGIGIARDFDGHDRRLGATLTAYHGGPRSQTRWQRFSNGFGCHYALGFLFDDLGNDSYNGTIMGLGMGWDLAAGFLVDFDGNDIFEATGGLTQGTGAEGSIGVLMEYAGNNHYKGQGQGYAGSKLTYHQPQDCGANFSFLIDHGGKDVYGCRAENNTMTQRGISSGFIIDRPDSQDLANLDEERRQLEEQKLVRDKDQQSSSSQMVSRPVQPATQRPSNSYQQTNSNYQQGPSQRGGLFGWRN